MAFVSQHKTIPRFINIITLNLFQITFKFVGSLPTCHRIHTLSFNEVKQTEHQVSGNLEIDQKNFL